MRLSLAVALLLALVPHAPRSEEAGARGLRLSSPRAFTGFTLFSPLGSRATHLVDMQGREVHRWTNALGTSQLAPSAPHLLPDGSILCCGIAEVDTDVRGGGLCGRLERIAWNGTLLWRYELATAERVQHHDVCPLPDGNVLLVVWERKSRGECLAAGRDPGGVDDGGLWPDAVLEVRPVLPDGGEIVWEWHAWDHLVQDRDPGAASHGRIAAHPERIDVNYDLRVPARPEEIREQAELAAEMRSLGYAASEAEDGAAAPPPVAGSRHGSDWLHTNAIDHHPGLDLIVLSSPYLSEVWVIDHSTTTAEAAGRTGGRYGRGGDLLWRWGNPANHGAGTCADRRLFAPHNAQWIADGCPGAGNLLVFDNGQGRPGSEYSSVDELAFSLVPGRGLARSGAEPVWSYRAERPASFYAAFMSGCQRLPNGNTLVCDGPQGRIFEVTRAGEVVWDYWNPHGGDPASGEAAGKALFRATRVAPDHPGLRGRVLAPLEPETQAH